MFPVIPFLSAVSMVVNVFALGWYRSRTREEQNESDKRVCGFAKELFGKCQDQLKNFEFKGVRDAAMQRLTH